MVTKIVERACRWWMALLAGMVLLAGSIKPKPCGLKTPLSHVTARFTA